MSSPVDQVRPFAVTVPAGTAVAAPQVTALDLEEYWVFAWVEVEVPPGPRGDLGFYLASSGTPTLPFSPPGAPLYFVMDDRLVRYDLTAGAVQGDWSAVAYNIGNYPHTFWVRFGLVLPTPPPPTPLSLLPAGLLSSIGP